VQENDKYLSSIGALIYSWYTVMYVGFIALHFAHSIIASLRIILLLVHLASAGGNPSRHVPKPRTIISMKCLDTSVLIPIRTTRLLRLPRQNAPACQLHVHFTKTTTTKTTEQESNHRGMVNKGLVIEAI
jgi:hypothetical protein